MIKSVALVVLILTAFIAVAESPKKFALVLGGVEQEGLPFDYTETFNTAFTKLKEGGYGVQSLIEKKPHVEFTAEGAKNSLKQMTEQVAKAPAGSQVLVVIESHGAPPSYGGTHKIVTTNGDLFDVGEFESLQKLAKEKGIRLAIVDLSCYSGQSLALAKSDPSTCVITGGSTDIVADAHFGKNLFERMKKGKDLEASFLEARSSLEYGYPQISTPEGEQTGQMLSAIHSISSPYKPDILTSFKKENCNESHLSSQISDLTKILQSSYGIPEYQAESLNAAFTDYISNRQTLQEDNEFLQSKIKILDREMTNEEFLYSGYSGSPEFLAAVEEKRKELNSYADERLMRIHMRRMFEAGFGYTIGKTNQMFWQLAKGVAASERPIYRSVYKANRSDESNACRDFQF